MDEQEVINYWNEHNIPKKVLDINKGKKKFYFLDGPPYATGNIHMGTALNKILKDYYLRYFRMRGYDVWCQPGYDCHGLPIENKVEKKLGIRGKEEIEQKVGVKAFIEECKHFATQYIDVMSQQFNDLGVWMHWDNPYLTLHKSYMEGAWYTFKKTFEKGLLYKGKYPVHVCPRCETVVAYNEIEYETREDTAVYVKFKLKGKDNDYLLIWTTTPWTLPANTGVMVHPKYEYAKVETMAGNLWIAKELVPTVMEKLEMGYKILEVVKGKDMEGWEYEHPMDIPLQKGIQGRVVLSDRFVNLEDGTGLVHCAPGHGMEDYLVGKENGLAQLSPLGLDGRFDDSVGKYAGMFAKDADDVIIEDLRKEGYLLKAERFSHEYPMCWRCNSPLLFISVPQWFFKIDKEKLIEANKKANWVPKWAGKRFENWLESLSDWPISRQRYWGIPLPIWVCDKCDKVKVVGSAKELGVDLDDLHKPGIDEVTLQCECGGTMRRVPDVLDVWFDSGVAPWASLGYPNQKEPFESMWPVDFVLEGPDQTRGWWNSLTICGVITFDRVPFENVLQHGLVLSEKGVKMSKSKGNAIEPEEVIEKYSRDLLRYLFLRYDPSLDIDFSWDKAKELQKFFTILDNVFNFFTLYCKKSENFENMKPEDIWIISKVNSLLKQVDEYNKTFQGYKSIQAIENFVINDLSRWYIKLIRNRTWPTYEGKDKEAAFATLYYVLNRVALMLAPALPHKTEMYNLGVFGYETIHAQMLPEPEKIDETIERQMDIVREIVEAVNSARADAKIKLRWPVEKLVVVTDNEEVRKTVGELSELLMNVCNVKHISLNEEFEGTTSEFSSGKVIISKKPIMEEALASDVIRQIQAMRKKAGLKVGDEIKLTISGHELLEKIKPRVVDKVNAKEYIVGEVSGEQTAEIDFMGKTIKIGFSRV